MIRQNRLTFRSGSRELGRRVLCLLLLGHASFLLAQEAEQSEARVYTPPAVDGEIVLPLYPSRELPPGGEGFVDVQFMVDVEGQAFEPFISASAGSDRFHAEALRVLEKTRFKPATLNGKPTVGAGSQRYYFTLRDAIGATEAFDQRYQEFRQKLTGGDRGEIEAALQAMEDLGVRNYYENAFLSLSRYGHAQQFGTPREQMEYAHGALSFADTADDPVYLPQAGQQIIWRELLALQARNQFFANAQDSWAIMQANGDEEAVSMFTKVMDAIEEIRTNDAEYAIPFTVPDSGTLWHKLYKPSFYISGGEGDVAAVALYCEAGYSMLELERDLDYTLPAKWGECGARITGDAGATFQLVQH